MRTRTVLASGLLALVLIGDSSARSAADECLAKPTGPTPKGQHWYYRIDHANSGRQCWYLRAESGRVQKTSRQTEQDPSGAMAQAIPAPAKPAAPAVPASAISPQENPAPAAAPIPWLNVQKLPEPISFAQPVTQQQPPTPAQSNGAAPAAASDNAVPEKAINPPVAVPNRAGPRADSNATSAHRAKEPQRRQQIQVRPEPPAPAIAHIDHTFALLMVMFAALAIAGPALHFVERRHRRETINYPPPPWARVVALNAPTPRIRALPLTQVAKSAAPLPIRPPDQRERLAHALQQLVDRLQTLERPEPEAVHIRRRGRVSL
jgi:hypothetical protein